MEYLHVSGVRDGYLTGRGRVLMRARTHIEDLPRNGRQAIVVDELPYQVNKKTLQEKIAELVHEKKIEGIAHIQDESDKSGMRLVIELKKGGSADQKRQAMFGAEFSDGRHIERRGVKDGRGAVECDVPENQIAE